MQPSLSRKGNIIKFYPRGKKEKKEGVKAGKWKRKVLFPL